MGSGAELIRPRATSIDPLAEPTLLTPLRRSKKPFLTWRRVGYATATVTWFVILLVVVFGLIAAPVGILQSSLSDTSLSESTAFDGADGLLGIFLVFVVVPSVLGTATVALFSAAAGFTLASATFFVRSFKPAYRGEQLSFTLQSSDGETVGPATTNSVALSLLPIRLTKWAKITLMIEFFGFIVNRSSFIIGTVWGWFYVFTLAWIFWPATGTALWICVAVSILLLALFAVTIWWRRKHVPTVMPQSFRGTVYEYSWPNHEPAEQG